ncbi:MAG: hypothetical protein JWO15_3692 [Sphingomonadales bacterium]|nr:hypothetical protein [Sphingomonadales bacterium]
MQALKDGLNAFRQNPKMMAVLFQNLSDKEFSEVMLFVTKTAINFTFNIPRKEVTPPTIAVTLRAESEEVQFLGDHMGTSPNWGLPPDEHLFDTVRGSAASPGPMTGAGHKIIGFLAVETSDASRIYFSDPKYTEYVITEDPRVGEVVLEAHVSAGTGRGQVFTIAEFHESYIDIQGTIAVPLDTTSKVDIRESNTLLLQGEPARVYNEDAVISRKGAYYGANYTLDILAGSQEQVICLYTLVRAIMFLFKGALEAQGLQNLIMSGSDIGTRNEGLPDNLFHRQLNLQFTYPSSVLIEEDVLTQLELCMSANDSAHLSLGTLDLESED